MSTYRVQVHRVCGTVELEVADCSSTEEAVKRAIGGLVAHPEEARELFDRAQRATPGTVVVEFMEGDVRVVG